MTDTTAITTSIAARAKPPIAVFRDRFVARRDEIKNALPSDVTPDHFIRAIVTAAQINPDMLACSFQSVWLACMRACRDGLLPDGREAAIVPYKTTATYIPMYQGLLKNFRKSGQCRWINADIVRDGEPFEHFVDETGEHFKHVPGDSDGAAEKVYAAALTKDGAFYVAVLSMKEINKIKSMSRATREDSPWKAWPEEMMKKTALRRLAKLLPSGRDITDDDDFVPDLARLTDGQSPPLQPYLPPQPEEPYRRPQSAADSLDQFAGSPTGGAPVSAEPANAPQSIDGNVTSTVDADGGDGQTVAADSDAQTIDHLASDSLKAAYQRGKDDNLKGMSRKAIPGEYRSADRSRELTAWQCGYDDKPMPTWTD